MIKLHACTTTTLHAANFDIVMFLFNAEHNLKAKSKSFERSD